MVVVRVVARTVIVVPIVTVPGRPALVTVSGSTLVEPEPTDPKSGKPLTLRPLPTPCRPTVGLRGRVIAVAAVNFHLGDLSPWRCFA